MKRPIKKDFAEQLIDNIAIPAFAINSAHVITHWNKALARSSGLSSAQMLGTKQQWRPFYTHERPTMADIIVDDGRNHSIEQFYTDKYRPSDVLKDAYEAEDYFPAMGKGEWLSFTAAPIMDNKGVLLGAVETLTIISDRKKAELELQEREESYRALSILDDLTRLYNARHLFKTLSLELKRCSRYGEQLTLCMLDLDGFKQLNDQYGHLMGNIALEAFGRLIKKNIRSIDSAYRYGGEEFIIMLPSSDEQSAFQVAERIRTDLAKTVFSTDEGESVTVTVSVGITAYRHGETEKTLLARVDQTMYRAKKEGRNRVVIFSSAA